MQQPITRQKVEELQKQNNTVKLIDIRTPAEYEKMHVPGALNLPAETIDKNNLEFAANDVIVCICNKGQERSQNAAEIIANMGLHQCFLSKRRYGWLAC